MTESIVQNDKALMKNDKVLCHPERNVMESKDAAKQVLLGYL